jgi:hypothetical protein
MSDALRELGLAADADERAIKRAYAARLKTTRPDTDPEGFQALNTAYQAALVWHQSKQAELSIEGEDTSEHDREIPPATLDIHSTDTGTAPAHEVTAQAPSESAANLEKETLETDHSGSGTTIEIDPDQFFDACFDAAHDGDPRVIADWLKTQPVLWSLQHKATIGHWLLQIMDKHTPPMPDRNFDLIAEFFNYYDLHNGYDPMALRNLRIRLNDAWRKQRLGQPVPFTPQNWAPGQMEQAREEVDPEYRQQRREERFIAKALQLHRHLLDPPNRWRDLRLCLFPGYVSSVRAFLSSDGEGFDALPARIRKDQIQFWLDAADSRRLSRSRLLIAATRCVAGAMGMMLIVLLTSLLLGPEGIGNTITIANAFGFFLALFSGLWVITALSKAFIYWQASADPTVAWQRWLQHFIIPALTLTSMGSAMQEEISPTPFVFGLIAMFTMVFRYRGRNGQIFKPTSAIHRLLSGMTAQHAVIALLLFVAILPALMIIEGLQPLMLLSLWVITISLWVRDLLKHSAA